MDMPSGRSPRRELQGPRPTPLKLRKDSHKIKKPLAAPQPVAHQPHHHHQQQPPHAPPRPPVIIYTVSPKIIHANPNEFMSLVQRLTGPNSSCTPSNNYSPSPSSSSSSSFALQDNGGAISPAARFASIEKTNRSPKGQLMNFDQSTGAVHEIEFGTEVQRTTGQFPGILSPNPNTLPPVQSKFFSPPSDNNYNSLSFFHDMSPVLQHSNRNNYLDNNLLFPSPSTFISPNISMPSPNTLDLFHSLFDL